MNCEIVQGEIVLALYGDLGAEALAMLMLHVDRCETCRREWTELEALHSHLSVHDALAEPSPNLLAASRMRLDEALDANPANFLWQQFSRHALRWTNLVTGAPALATLLLGMGFLSGDFLHRYQAAHAPRGPVVVTSPGSGPIASISGIQQTPNSEVVQVNYNRLVPEAMQGSLDDPQIRQLLLLGAKLATDNAVHDNSVALLASACEAEQACGADGTGSPEVRNVLLSTLRSDRSSAVRLKALRGLQPYVSRDEHVRDAVLEALMRDKSPDVRTEAIALLEPVGADSSVRQVLRSVSSQDANPAIRNASFHALQGAADIE